MIKFISEIAFFLGIIALIVGFVLPNNFTMLSEEGFYRAQFKDDLSTYGGVATGIGFLLIVVFALTGKKKVKEVIPVVINNDNSKEIEMLKEEIEKLKNKDN